MTQGPRWQVVIVDLDIALQGRRQGLPGATAVGRQDLADAAVKALDPAVGLGMARRDEAVLEVRCVADPVAAVLAGRFPLTGRAEPVGEFLAVSGQDGGDLKGGGVEEMGQEALGAGGGLLRQDLNLDPARGAVDGGEAVATRVRVGQLRQVRDIDRHHAGGIVFEGRIGRLAARVTGQQRLEVRDPRAAPAPIQTGARHPRVQERAGHRQAVIPGQQPGLAPGHHHRRRGRRAGGVQVGCRWGAGGVQVVCRWCGRCERSVVSARRRHWRPVAWVR